MGFSSYQIGRLIGQMRKAGLLEGPSVAPAPGVDRVELSGRHTGPGPRTLRLAPATEAEVPDETPDQPGVAPTQVMRLIEELREARLLEPGAPAPAAGEALSRAPLRVLPARPGGSTVAVEASTPPAELPVAAVREAAVPSAPVQAELERRAGSFMQPPLEPSPSPPPIPKARHRLPGILPPPKPRGEGE